MKKLRFFDSLKFVRAIFVAVACIFAFAPAHAAILPAGYTELEYIESVAGSYINTEIIATSNTKVETVVDRPVPPPNGTVWYLFTTKNDSTNGQFSVFESTNALGDKYFALTYGKVSSSQIKFGVTSSFNKSKFVLAGGVLTVDNGAQTVMSSQAGQEFNTMHNIWLFGREDTDLSNVATVKMYYFKIYDGDTLVCNLVPAKRNSDNVIGMYDLADANPATAFHTNDGTGDFVAGPAVPIKIATTRYNEEQFKPVKTDLSAAVNAVEYVVSNTMSQAQAIDQIANEKQTRPDEGCPAKYCLLVEDEDGTPHWYPIAGANGVAHNLPAGYTELQYIEGNGTQYINNTGLTGFNTGDWEIYVKWMSTSATQRNYAYIASVFSGDDYDTYRVIAYGTRGDFYIVNGNSKSSGGGRGAGGAINEIHEATIKNGSVVFDGTTYETSTKGATLPATEQLTILGKVVGNAYKGRIYSVKVTKDGVVRADLVPARNSSGVVGLYDLADANPATAFHTNAGTGVFGEGPDM